MTRRVIAIDGPAGTGKSSTARGVARRLGWPYVDSGAFYRAAALLALRHELDPGAAADRSALRYRLSDAEIEQGEVDGRLRTLVDGEDVSRAIRAPAVSRLSSRVAVDPGLRAIVNDGLRTVVGEGPAVVDGRDIGSVVFPDAALKIYLVASLEERARRRARESEPPDRADDPALLADYARQLAERDRADSERTVAPLRPAPDAIEIDNSRLTPEEQIAEVLDLAAGRGLTSGRHA